MKKSLVFRKFDIQDTEQVLNIYNYYIINSSANFEEKKMTKSNFLIFVNKIINSNLPFIVSELENKIIGFTFLSKFRNKSGYRYTFENSIYVHKNHTGKKIGNKLLSKLIKLSSNNKEIKTIIAVIGGKNAEASIKIHTKNGFEKAGILKKVGFKNNQWVDTIYMQKNINEKN